MPIASELHAADDQTRLKAVFLTGTRLTLAIFCAIGVTIAALAKPALTVWVGRDYAMYAPIVVVLVIAGFIELCQYPAGAVLQGMTRHRPLAAIAVVSAVANLVISIVLIQRIGIIGAAVGTLIPAILEGFLLVLPYTLRVLGVPAKALIREAFVPALLPAIPTPDHPDGVAANCGFGRVADVAWSRGHWSGCLCSGIFTFRCCRE